MPESSASSANYATQLAAAAELIRKLRLQLSRQQAPDEDAIAVIGVGCRFPGGADSPEAFWKQLESGTCSITDFPSDRCLDANGRIDPRLAEHAYVMKAGYIHEATAFDLAFFGQTPREAENSDPQQRLALEVAWQAFHNAGLNIDKLRGSSTGVFIGVSTTDYARLRQEQTLPEDVDIYQLGAEPSGIAGRISYFFDFHGPALVIDTACSSSLTTTHLARRSLLARECDLAIAGGVNLILNPYGFVMLCRAHALSPNGQSATFDAAADGYTRGEGCGMVVLKRLSDAIRDRDPILCTLISSAVNHDGKTAGPSVPNIHAQQAVMRSAIAKANIKANDVTYVEAHGTGTPLGDPIELRAIESVYGVDRDKSNPLLVGAVKPNIGHLEAAAGVAGLIKIALAFDKQTIPRNINFNVPNPAFQWNTSHVQVVSKNITWNRQALKRIAGVSSFGASGSNAHALIAAPPHIECELDESPLSTQYVMALSAKSQAALPLLIQEFVSFLKDRQDISPRLLCQSHNHRVHYSHRKAFVFNTVEDLIGQLQTALAQGVSTNNSQNSAKSIGIAFGFSDHFDFSKPVECRHLPQAFHAAISRIATIVDPIIQSSLEEYLHRSSKASQPAVASLPEILGTFAIQYAIAEAWLAFNIRPQLAFGLGFGEYAAACIAGCLSLDEAVDLIVREHQLPSAYGKGVEHENSRIETEWLELKQKYWGRSPRVCKLITPFKPGPFEPDLHNFLSTSSPPPDLTAEIIGKVIESGVDTLVAIGDPSRADNSISRHEGLDKLQRIDSMGITSEDHKDLSQSLAHLYESGIAVDWETVYPRIAPPYLTPAHPISRKHCWFTPSQKISEHRQDDKPAEMPVEQAAAISITRLPVAQPTYTCQLVVATLPNIISSTQAGYSVLPTSLIITLASLCARHLNACSGVELNDTSILQPIIIRFQDRLAIQFVFDNARQGKWQCYSQTDRETTDQAHWTQHAQGEFRASGRATNSSSSFKRASEIAVDDLPIQINSQDSKCELQLSIPSNLEEEELWLACGYRLDAALLASAGLDAASKRHYLGHVASMVVEQSVGASESAERTLSVKICGPLFSELQAEHFSRAAWLDPAELAYRFKWQEESITPTALLNRNIVLLSDNECKLDDWAAELVEMGSSCVVFESTSESRSSTSCDPLENLRLHLETIATAPSPRPSLNVVVGWGLLSTGLNEQRSVEDNLASLNSVAADTFYRVVELANLLGHFEKQIDIQLWLLTRGSQAIDGETDAFDLGMSPLWSLGRSISLEKPQIWGGLIDLDPMQRANEAIDISRELVEHSEHESIAYRNNKRYVLRLTVAEPLKADVSAPVFRDDAAYLITGGLGNIGRKLIDWMFARGARRFLLCSRRAFVDKHQWSDQSLPVDKRRIIEQLRELEGNGAEIEILSADVGNPKDIDLVLQHLADGKVELAGIFHAAGISDPRVLDNVDLPHFQSVLRSKIDGAWLLHQKTKHLPLDCFVMFSSVASAWGSQELAAYATANHFLDALAMYRKACNLPALSINWGPWLSQTELAGEDVLRFLDAIGIKPLSPSQCLNVMGKLMSHTEPQMVIAGVNWRTFLQVYQARGKRRLLQSISESIKDTEAEPSQAKFIFAGMSEQMITQEVTKYLQGAFATAIGSDEQIDPLTNLLDSGLDSLIAMELMSQCKTDLGVLLFPNDLFQRTTIKDIAELIAAKLKTTDGSPGSTELHSELFDVVSHEMKSAADTYRVDAAPTSTDAQLALNSMEVIPSFSINPQSTGGDFSDAILQRIEQAGIKLPGDLDEIVHWPDDLECRNRAQGISQPRAVFLSGVTGFVGGFVLAHLLKSTEAKLHCLVRCRSEEEGLRRIHTHVAIQGMSIAELSNRISIVPGHLDQARFGLPQKDFEYLADAVEVIFHIGATVNFVQPLERVRAANYLGTLEMLRLANLGTPKVLQHVSTHGIWGFPMQESVFFEDQNILEGGWLTNGYLQSKWMSERLVMYARNRGFSVNIFRLGRITGDSTTGRGDMSNHIWRMVFGCLQLGVYPTIDLRVDLTPVDYVAAVLQQLTAIPSGSAGGNYHVISHERIGLTDICEHLKARSHLLEQVDREEWWKRLVASVGKTNNILHPLLDSVESLLNYDIPLPAFDISNTLRDLAGSGISCSPPNAALLNKYFDNYEKYHKL